MQEDLNPALGHPTKLIEIFNILIKKDFHQGLQQQLPTIGPLVYIRTQILILIADKLEAKCSTKFVFLAKKNTQLTQDYVRCTPHLYRYLGIGKTLIFLPRFTSNAESFHSVNH